MEKMQQCSSDIQQKNIELIAKLFPNCISEFKDKNGHQIKSVDFDKLKLMLDAGIPEGSESFDFTWVGKQEALINANMPTSNTLRPVKEESKNWDSTENLYIKGDNFEVLKTLQESYLNKVQFIYIDPPYNTGNNLIYKNNFYENYKDYQKSSGAIDDEDNCLFVNGKSNGRFHSDWCSMIYSRLVLARRLLANDGIICLTIDDSEIQNVTMIMNEIFGEECHLATIVIKNNPSGRSTTKGVSISHEYALFYGSTSSVKLGRLPRNKKQISRYKEEDDIGKFEWVNFRKHGGYMEDAPTMYYPIYIKKDGSDFRIPKLKWNAVLKEYDILEEPSIDESVLYPIDDTNRKRRWKWSLERANNELKDMSVRKDRNGDYAIYIKSRMNDEGMLPLTVWDNKLYSSTEYGTNLLIDILGDNYFDYPKSIYAVIDCLRIGCLNKNGLVLDFFSGSATTAHAVMQLNAEDKGNRKYIMVQLPEKTDEKSEAYKAGYKNICDIGKERIYRAANIIRKEYPESTIDDGFRVFQLDSSNMKDVYYSTDDYTKDILEHLESNIKEDRSDLDLLFGCLIDWGLPISKGYESETIDGYTVHTYDEDALIACFDDDVSEKCMKEIAKRQPIRAIFKDSSFSDSAKRINVEEMYKMLSPNTTVKVI